MNYVVTVDVDANIAGYRLGVQEATLTLGVNAIPSINLTCAPVEGSMAPLRPYVAKPSIRDFSVVYKELAEKAEGLSEYGYVNISVHRKAKGASEDTDEVALQWILSSVGLSGIGATSGPYLSVVLQHPMCKLTKVGSIYETPKAGLANELNTIASAGQNFLNTMSLVNGFLSSYDGGFWPAPDNSNAPEFRHALGTSEFSPEAYLVYRKGAGEGNFFLAGDDWLMEQSMAKAIGRFVTPMEGDASEWDTILRASGQLLLSVVQDTGNDFTSDKLIIEPSKPWKRASIRLLADECHGTDMPGMDPFRIQGVMCRKLGPYNDTVSLGLINNGNLLNINGEPVSEVMYSPPGVNPGISDGRIMKTSAPVMLDSAFRRDAPHGTSISLMDVNDAAAAAEAYNSTLMKYCQAVYELTTGSMVSSVAQMALWFKDADGNRILPGNTCYMEDRGDKLYYGYIRNVVHHMSTQGGCGTTVTMSHVRPEENFKIKGVTAIAAGSPNAAYT